MNPPEEDNNNNNVLHYTCALCENICTPDELTVHPCLDNFTKYFLDKNLYFYPQCDDGTILRRSLVDGREIQVAETLLSETDTDINVRENSLDINVGEESLDINVGGKSLDEQLILAVQAREPLWNFRLPLAQRGKHTKEELWENVCVSLKGKYTVAEAKKRWKNLYDTLKKYDGQEKDVRSGSAATAKVKWQYYENMKFVRDVNLNNKRTTSNMTGNESSIESEEESRDVDHPVRAKLAKTQKQPQEAINKLVDALSAPLPPIVLPPPPPLPPAPAPPDRVDGFLIMVGHSIRSLDEKMQNEAMFKIHEFIYSLQRNQ